MNQLTRQQVLSAIEQKIARTHQSNEGTGCFLPVVMTDCDTLIEKGPGYFDKWIPILDLWTTKLESLDKQSDKCVSYIYSLL